MAEYVSKDAVRQMLGNRYGGFLLELDAVPAADVAPVVRCKDCKWFADNNDGEWYGCQMLHVVLITPEDAPKPNDFCSYGERKETDHDN